MAFVFGDSISVYSVGLGYCDGNGIELAFKQAFNYFNDAVLALSFCILQRAAYSVM